jgi:predicted dinucleotide-binding enzyme
MKIAVFGFGNVGKQLAALFSAAGHDVLIGSKNGNQGGDTYRALPLQTAAEQADMLAIALPFGAVKEVLAPLASVLAGKIVVDVTNPVNADWSPMLLGEENSAAEEIARLVPQAHLVKAFNTIFADVMPQERHDRAGHLISAFVASDHADASATVVELARACHFSPVAVGPLRMARQLEALAHLNIQIAAGQGGGTNAAFVYHQG